MSVKPKITIDVGPLFDTHWTGIPVFTRRLVVALLRHGGVDVDFAFNLLRIPSNQVLTAIGAGTGVFLRTQFEANSATGSDLPDPSSCFFYPATKGTAGGISRREASTVHDLSALFTPEIHEEPNIARHLDHLAEEIASDEAVFCVSDATRAVLTAAFPSAEKKARLLYQYVDWPDEFTILDRNMPRLAFGRYAVIVGTIEPRKNLGLLVKALSLPEIARSDIKFIVIGGKGWLVDEFLAGLSPEITERIIFAGFVSEFVKYRLIKNAEFLIALSLYEGFGIPALEAMSLGKPVLAARTSSFPEVVGDAGIYFDPMSPSNFAAAFGEIDNPAKILELSRKAIAQNASFGWQRMAAPIVDWVCG